ncbi:MAG TPA: PEP-CTERM sorting domain-containing protein [Candidatus Paceibacterota bacterium]|nr:PEP-CTERM sorting domain-containing protein [Candidatus Paceibacterota bacterium]
MAALAGGIIGAGCMAAANAQLTSYEPFSGYTIGAQVTVTTPSPATSGYTGNWTAIDWGDGHPVVNSGPLSYSGAGYAGGVGNHIGLANAAFDQPNSGRMYRLLDSSLAATASTTGTRYLSWLFQSGNQGVTTYQMLDLYNSNTADPNRNFTAGITQNGGNSGSQYDFGVAEAYTSTGVSVDTGVHLFVVKFDFSASAASDNVTLWLDPTLGAGDPATGGIVVSGKDLVFDRLAISDYDENSANWGEIRWGTTFDSVTTAAVPEPSTFALMGLGALGFLLRRKH